MPDAEPDAKPDAKIAKLLPYEALGSQGITDADLVIFGGTFDPPHEGHVTVVTRLLAHFRRIFVAPTLQNPWKAQTSTDLLIRAEMLRAIFEWESIPLACLPDQDGVTILDERYVYSAELANTILPTLERQSPVGRLYWAVSEDVAEGVSRWNKWGEQNVPTVVLPIVTEIHSAEIRSDQSRLHPALRQIVRRERLYSSAS